MSKTPIFFNYFIFSAIIYPDNHIKGFVPGQIYPSGNMDYINFLYSALTAAIYIICSRTQSAKVTALL